MLVTMMRDEGAMRPLRGMGAMVAGAGPAHALYFAAYERLKVGFTSKGSANHNYWAQGAAASAATVIHDGIMTPAEGIHHVSHQVLACCRGKSQISVGRHHIHGKEISGTTGYD